MTDGFIDSSDDAEYEARAEKYEARRSESSPRWPAVPLDLQDAPDLLPCDSCMAVVWAEEMHSTIEGMVCQHCFDRWGTEW